MTTLTQLECTPSAADETLSMRRRQANLCECGGPLAARYDLERARQSWSRDWVNNGPSNMWRYAPVLPVSKPSAMVSLGEGMTPLVRTPRLGERLGASRPLGEGRRRQPDRLVQGAGPGLRRLDGASNWASGSWPSPRPATRPARWPPTPPRPASKRTSSCRATCRRPISSSARPSARASRWWTASSATAPAWSPSAGRGKAGSTSAR